MRNKNHQLHGHALLIYERVKYILVLLAALCVTSSCATRPSVEAFATGLNQPRGMVFDAAGNLFVAETGAPDPTYSAAVQPEINHSGRVVRIDERGHLIVIIEGLPYTRYTSLGDIGPTDVALLGDTLYVLTGEGYDDLLSRSVLRVSLRGATDPTPQPLANLLAFAVSLAPLESQMSTGIAPSNPYAMVAAPDGRAFYITDGATGRVLRVTLDGQIQLFAELPNLPPLAGLSFGPDGKLYVAMFSPLPHTPGSGEIWGTDAAGVMTKAVGGLTMPIDVAFDATSTMYVLEFSDGQQPEQPYSASSGRLLRIMDDGAKIVILDDLNYPTAMAFSPQGDLYIAVGGAFSTPGKGAILKAPYPALSKASH